MVFKSDHQLYEIIMTACTSKEEAEWLGRLQRPLQDGHQTRDPNMHSFLALDIQSLGPVFSKPGTRPYTA